MFSENVTWISNINRITDNIQHLVSINAMLKIMTMSIYYFEWFTVSKVKEEFETNINFTVLKSSIVFIFLCLFPSFF